MAPTIKENEVLKAPPQTATATTPFGVGTETSNRPQPVALEVPVTVNGARALESSNKREPFSETTKTVLVFGNGAVIRLSSPVTAGQLLFLTNEKTKKEVVCQVVKSKNYKNVSGYVELEFTESVVGFWGMRFPTDRLGGQAPASVTGTTVPSTQRVSPLTPVPAAPTPKPVNPVASAAPKLPEVKLVQMRAEVKPAPLPRPVEVKPVAPAAPIPVPAARQTSAAPIAPVVRQPELPMVPAFPISTSLASSLASILNPPESQPVFIPVNTEQEPAKVAGDNSSEELKLQTARLQEQLSSLLFSAVPTEKPVGSAPFVPTLDPKAVSNVAASVLEIAKSEIEAVRPIPAAKAPVPPVKSTLDIDDLKIPSWLEPLARNAAAPAATQDVSERDEAKHTSEISAREERPAELLPVPAEESIPESQSPAFGSLLPLDEEVSTDKQSSGGSHKGVLIGTIAAAVLLGVGVAWYLLRPASSAQTTRQPVASVATPQTAAAPPVSSVGQPASQNAAAASLATPNSNAPTPSVTTPTASAPSAKLPVSPKPVPVTKDNTRGNTIPAAATERISRPEPQPEAIPDPKKPALGEVHLTSPKMNRPASKQDDGVAAPAISSDEADANATGLGSGLATGDMKQPSAPETPLPTGGDVQSAKLISKVAPLYPTLAKSQHITGNVVIDALIDVNGRVGAMKVISGPALLHQSATEALRQWKYQPATLDGKPVPMHLTVTLQFREQ
jgi:protein TonB